MSGPEVFGAAVDGVVDLGFAFGGEGNPTPANLFGQGMSAHGKNLNADKWLLQALKSHF